MFQIHTSRMTLADDVNLENFEKKKKSKEFVMILRPYVQRRLLAFRERRMKVKFCVLQNLQISCKN